MQQRQGVSNGQRAQDNFECAFKLVCVLKYMAFPMTQWQRICLQEIQETQVQSLGIGNGNLLLYSYLGNPMDRGSLVGYSPWGHKSWTQLRN